MLDPFERPIAYLRISVDFNDIRGSLLHAVGIKPAEGTQCTDRAMVSIGG